MLHQRGSLMLYQKTLTLLHERPKNVTFKIIAHGTGLGTSWLSALSQGQIKDPSAKKLEKLYNFLSDKPLI